MRSSTLRSKEDLLDTCASSFEAGLLNNGFCIWAVSHPATEQTARALLRRSIPGFDRYLAAGQIEIVRGPEWLSQGRGVRLAADHWRLACKTHWRLGQGLRRHEGQRQCVLDRRQLLEAVLRVRAGARSFRWPAKG
jgi:hypothetical protein